MTFNFPDPNMYGYSNFMTFADAANGQIPGGFVIPEGMAAPEVAVTPDIVAAAMSNTLSASGSKVDQAKTSNPSTIEIKPENQPLQVEPMQGNCVGQSYSYTTEGLVGLINGYFRIAFADIDSGYILPSMPNGKIFGRIYCYIGKKIDDSDKRLRIVNVIERTNDPMTQILQMNYLQKNSRVNITQSALDIFKEFLIGWDPNKRDADQLPLYTGLVALPNRSVDPSGYLFVIDKIDVVKVLQKLVFQDTAGNRLDISLRDVSHQYADATMREYFLDVVDSKKTGAVAARIAPQMAGPREDRGFTSFSGN